MSSLTAPRCRHIKANGTQCGSPALRSKKFCFYHQNNRPLGIGTYSKKDDSFSQAFDLPIFEDAHSIQAVLRQVSKMILINEIELKPAGLLLYALQIASSNLKRLELEKPQPEQVVTDIETDEKTKLSIAVGENADQISTTAQPDSQAPAATDSTEMGEYIERSEGDEPLPPGTIHAYHAYRVKSPAKSRRNGEKPRLQ
jgi:hypothetical protein